MHKSLTLPALCLALASTAHAREVTFEYTDTETCTRVAARAENNPGEEEEPAGEDAPIECMGPGGEYMLVEWYSAFDFFRDIRLKGGTEVVVSLRPPDTLCPAARFSPKLEWRMKDGKPFAVIQRVSCHAVVDNMKHGKKLGEYLVVKGLKGYEAIDGLVPTKAKNANSQARALADAGLAKQKR
ncbi:hypothetical protein HPC49_08855 [Pyxidicoccus fallax]|uniref:Lipoprotein n=1 Tax=Pyxidicoccus fallax TaxID=394095 RepID=A0A848LAS8_9BACT|nr:hypothetical protein [Pyxidicoccus fallax]NMO13955.1 hypothetical protein [Pyxidicoccus fallax]NPC78354.1 hypothetical protein [Pyxidicoccus fallax]